MPTSLFFVNSPSAPPYFPSMCAYNLTFQPNKLEMDSIYDIFLSSVDDLDNPRFLHERAPEENPKGYYYRYPYRNDLKFKH